MYSTRLFESTSRLFRDTYFAKGPSCKLNPSSVKAGPMIDFQPIAIFNLRIGYEFVEYFGAQGYLQSYEDTDASYSDNTRKDMEQSAYSTQGHHYYIEPALQVKVGCFAARTKFAFEYWIVKLHEGDNYFYDGQLDTLVPNRKLIWTNDTDLLFVNGRLTAGLRYSEVMPGARGAHMRVGPLLAWSFNKDDYTSFNKPTLLMVLGWYLRHEYRMGPVPYVCVGFSFSADFLKSAD